MGEFPLRQRTTMGPVEMAGRYSGLLAVGVAVLVSSAAAQIPTAPADPADPRFFMKAITMQFGIDPGDLGTADQDALRAAAFAGIEVLLPGRVLGIDLQSTAVDASNAPLTLANFRMADTKVLAYLDGSLTRGEVLTALILLVESPVSVTLSSSTVLTVVTTSLENMDPATTTAAGAVDTTPQLAVSKRSSSEDDHDGVIIGLVAAILIVMLCCVCLAYVLCAENDRRAPRPSSTPSAPAAETRALEMVNEGYLTGEELQPVTSGAHYYPGPGPSTATTSAPAPADVPGPTLFQIFTEAHGFGDTVLTEDELAADLVLDDLVGRLPDMFRHFHLNSDGKVEAAELMAVLDENNDGRITVSEFIRTIRSLRASSSTALADWRELGQPPKGATPQPLPGPPLEMPVYTNEEDGV